MVESFPANAKDSLKLLIRADLEEDLPAKSRVVFSDLLLPPNGFSGPPRKRQDLRMKSSKLTDYEPFHVYNHFNRFSAVQVDPFCRFNFESLHLASFWYDRWKTSDENSRGGTIAEAALVCHVLQTEKCFNCKTEGWNGGSASCWQDMVCLQCKSTYEIKSKASADKVTEAFVLNNFRGGSYSRFWKIKNGLQSNQKMYLVTVSRQPSFDVHGSFHPIHIAEIDRVLPRLDPLSFYDDENDRKSIRIQSNIQVHGHTKCIWILDVPAIPLTDELYNTLFEDAFLKRFPSCSVEDLRVEFLRRTMRGEAAREKVQKGASFPYKAHSQQGFKSLPSQSQPHHRAQASRVRHKNHQRSMKGTIKCLNSLAIEHDSDDSDHGDDEGARLSVWAEKLLGEKDLGYSARARNPNRLAKSTKLSVVRQEDLQGDFLMVYGKKY